MSNSKNTSTTRRYPEVAAEILQFIFEHELNVGDRIPSERHLTERFNVSRSLLREALIMLEIQKIVEVRQGSGVYIAHLPDEDTPNAEGDIGPFELMQARQVLESSVAEVAAYTVTKSDIVILQDLLIQEKETLDNPTKNYAHDENFHLQIARATQNNVLVESVRYLWELREHSSMWKQLHKHIVDNSYRAKWLDDHQVILQALKRKDPVASRHAMWQHLENVRHTLLALSDVEAPEFDGFLFQSLPILSAGS